MVKVEISLEAFQPTTSNILIVHKFQPPLHSVFPWNSGGIKLDYMSLAPTNTVKPQEIMHVFLGGFSLSLYLLDPSVFTSRIKQWHFATVTDRGCLQSRCLKPVCGSYRRSHAVAGISLSMHVSLPLRARQQNSWAEARLHFFFFAFFWGLTSHLKSRSVPAVVLRNIARISSHPGKWCMSTCF